MTPETDMSNWLTRRNLRREVPSERPTNTPAEVAAYMLVTLARHPRRIPTAAAIYVADRFLGHCVESTDN